MKVFEKMSGLIKQIQDAKTANEANLAVQEKENFEKTLQTDKLKSFSVRPTSGYLWFNFTVIIDGCCYEGAYSVTLNNASLDFDLGGMHVASIIKLMNKEI